MKQVLIFAVLLAIAHVTKSINPHKVFRIYPATTDQIEILYQFYKTDKDISFWRINKRLKNKIDVMVSPEKQASFRKLLYVNGIPYKIFINHVQCLIAASSMDNKKSEPPDFDWTSFHTLDEIYDWMDYLAKSYPAYVTIITAGLTYNNKEIKGLKLSLSGPEKPWIVFEGGIHPREWMSPATVTYLLNQFLTSKRRGTLWLAKSYNWLFLPVINPDGYEYTYQKAHERNVNQRLWQNTRSVNFANRFNDTTHGADLNTNWMIPEVGDNLNKLQRDRYHEGNLPFSEIETKTLSMYLTANAKKIMGYISFRGYGQELMFPYGYTLRPVNNYEHQNLIAIKAAQALKKRYNTKYEVGSINRMKGSVYGNSLDWVKDYLGVPLVYVYGMRDTGNYGLLPPPSEIIPNGQEILDSLIVMFREAKILGYS